jgi:ribonuclease HI
MYSIIETRAIDKFVTFCNEQEQYKDDNNFQEKLVEYKNVFLKQDTIFVFTDGSCCGNGKAHATAGIGIYIPCLKVNISQPLDAALGSVYLQHTVNTNQRAELTAILKALIVLSTQLMSTNKNSNIEIHSDSMYSINCVTKWYKTWERNGWMNSTSKPVMNKDIIQRIVEILKESKNVKFCYVKAHTKEPSKDSVDHFLWQGNNIADELATRGSKV